MQSNAYFLAKFRFDTAENESAKNLQNFVQKQNVILPGPRRRPRRRRRRPGRRRSRAGRCPSWIRGFPSTTSLWRFAACWPMSGLQIRCKCTFVIVFLADIRQNFNECFPNFGRQFCRFVKLVKVINLLQTFGQHLASIWQNFANIWQIVANDAF